MVNNIVGINSITCMLHVCHKLIGINTLWVMSSSICVCVLLCTNSMLFILYNINPASCWSIIIGVCQYILQTNVVRFIGKCKCEVFVFHWQRVPIFNNL